MASLKAQLSGETEQFAPQSDIREVDAGAEPEPAHSPRARQTGLGIMAFSIVLAAFWAGAACAYLWGYFGPRGLSRLDPELLSFLATVIVLPPVFFLACAFALVRAKSLSDSALHLAEIAGRLTAVDDRAVKGAQSLGRAVRRELDALSSGLDAAFGRLRALETALADRVAQLEDASARAGVKAEHIAQRLRDEREGIEEFSTRLDEVSATAAEILAGRCAQLKTMIEAAGGELKAAGRTLDAQVAQFREAADKAASAPQAAAVELDRQAKQIESAAETAVGRAEFVLARQERQRTAMSELLVRLKEDMEACQSALESQRNFSERATAALSGEAQRLNQIAVEGARRLEAAMGDTALQSAQLASGFTKDADFVKDTADIAAAGIAKLVEAMREAANHAEALFADSAANAKRRSIEFVGDATVECDHLRRAAASVAEETERARAALARAADEAQDHILKIPGIAAQEALRVREALRVETEQMIDLSARTITILQSRSSRRAAEEREREATGADGQAEPGHGGLRGLARLITRPKRRAQIRGGQAPGNYQLSAVLAAADAGVKPGLSSGTAAHLAGMQAVLADLAGDLEMAVDSVDPALWRRYLEGDRGAFARSLAASIGPDSVNRITALYRDKSEFHDAADAYIAEFEAMLVRARKGDADGFLASTLLTADTGKIYLTLAYALGRLE